MTNKTIRKALIEYELKQWQLAEILKIREDSLSRKLRRELPEEEQRAIVKQIEEAMQE